MVSLVWNGDRAGPEFFFFVVLPAQSIGQVLALAFGLSKLDAGLDRDLGFDIRLSTSGSPRSRSSTSWPFRSSSTR